jgi:hypothetical protein
MSVKELAVDAETIELADHFLASDEDSDRTPAQQRRRRMALAQAIQQAVEDWMADEAVRE